MRSHVQKAAPFLTNTSAIAFLCCSTTFIKTERGWYGSSDRKIDGQSSSETHYYISSLDPDAAKLLAAIRTYWTVENHLYWVLLHWVLLHWVLDVAFDEDACRIRKDYAPQNFSLLRHIALNLFGQDKTTKAGIAAKRKKAGWDDAYLLKIVSQRFSCVCPGYCSAFSPSIW
jgi:predicted transposase YbfD/YdcC